MMFSAPSKPLVHGVISVEFVRNTTNRAFGIVLARATVAQ